MGDPEGADAFYATAGRIIMLWGRFENHLDLTLLSIVNLPEAEPLRVANREPVPASFKPKAKLWRRAFGTVGRLEPWKERALALITDALDASKCRAAIVHSAWNGFTSADPLTVHAIHRRYEGPTIRQSVYDFTLPQLERLQTRLDGLNTRLLPITSHVASLYPPPRAGGRS